MNVTLIRHKRTIELLPAISITRFNTHYVVNLSWLVFTIDISR